MLYGAPAVLSRETGVVFGPVLELEMTEDGVGTGVWSHKARLQLVCCATSVVCALISEWTEF